MKSYKNIIIILICCMSIIKTLCAQQYYGQVGQDKYLHTDVFKNKKNGTFVDIGADNGIAFSNTYFLKKILIGKAFVLNHIQIDINNL